MTDLAVQKRLRLVRWVRVDLRRALSNLHVAVESILTIARRQLSTAIGTSLGGTNAHLGLSVVRLSLGGLARVQMIVLQS